MTTLTERHRDRVRTRSASFTQVPKTDQLVEVAGIANDAFARSLGYYSADIVLNPDPVLRSQAAGKGIDLFEEVEEKDPNVFSDLQTRKLGVIGLDWEIVAASQDTGDVAAAAFAAEVLKGVPGFSEDLYQLLDAVGKGFAVNEILWSARPDGRIGIAEIKSRHQRRFTFDVDNNLRLLSDANTIEGTQVPPRKFLVHTFQSAHENPYGRGILSRVYWYYWFKKNALKFWALFAEKFGSPTAIGKHPPGTDDGQKRALLSALEAIQQETAITIPDNMTAEFLEAQRTGTIETYSRFLEYLDRQCTKAILGQTLTSSEGARSGSLALGWVHQGVRQDILEADVASLAGVLNGQLIPWLTDWNFLVTAFPKLVFKLSPPADLDTRATRDQALQKMGTPIPKSYVQRTYGIPAPDGPEDVLTPPAPAPVSGLGFAEIFRAADRLLEERR